MRHALTHARHAVRNAFFSQGRRLFGLGFARDYLRFAWRASRQLGSDGPGSFEVVGCQVDYWNQSHALFLLHEIFVNAEYAFDSDSPHPRIVDCGANLGLSVVFFKALYPHADVLAFEPDPVTYARLRRTVEANRLESVVTEEAAVTEHGGRVQLYRDASDLGSIAASVDPRWNGGAGREVRSVRLSDHITGTVDFLKIDIEGAEYGVVRNLVQTGALRSVRAAAIEYHHVAGMPDALQEMTDALRNDGFGLRVRPSSDGSPTGMIHARRAR
jgi:FkbM family methyltransferase